MNTIQMTRLGSMGRHGNRLFQSAFLACYAKAHDLRVEAPEFECQHVFPFSFDPVSTKLPEQRERFHGAEDRPPEPPDGGEFINRDAVGFFQFHTSWYRPHKGLVQGMWSPRESERVFRAMGGEGFAHIGVHYRGGDYPNKLFMWRAPFQWYLDWLAEHFNEWSNPRLFVATEDASLTNQLAAAGYEPRTARSIGLKGTFTDDWTILRNCDVILCPNSTFSFTAAMANPQLSEAWRASLPCGRFVKFNPWNDTPLLYDKIEDYPEYR